MKIGIILLARMGSSRLPGKVLKPLCGKSVLEHIVQRLRKVKDIDELIVATSKQGQDDVIEQLCRQIQVACFRGSEDNVLSRCIEAARHFDLDAVIRLGADSPVIDWEVINEMLTVFKDHGARGMPLDYVSNSLARSYPLGLDADILTWETLLRIDKETQKLSKEERLLNESNVIPYLHQHLDQFKTYSFSKPFDYSDFRWTLDTPEDFALIENIYNALYDTQPDFRMPDILRVLEEHPHWCAINSHVVPRTGFWTEKEREKLNRKLAGPNG